MRVAAAFTLLPALAVSIPTLNSQSPLPNDFASESADPEYSTFGWPSVHESTVQARRILKLHNISTLSTVFPKSKKGSSPDDVSTLENRPSSVDGAPIALMDYHASCSGEYAYDPVIIGVTIATTMRNAAAGSNVTLSMRYHLPSPPSPVTPPDPWAYLAANLPRFSLVGYIERLSEEEVKENKIKECFFETHPDAKLWAPGGDIEPHESWWAALRVQEVYFFGGFGDRARISWLPIEEWRNVTEKEVDEYRMVGEKGWEKVQEMYKGGEWRLEVEEGVQTPMELK